MAFVNDREDVYSLALTVVQNLLQDYNIDPNSIGRIDVGTETLLDKSKSVKSVLMQLFGENTDIEGLDSINACYGGTNALFNAVNWIESSSWDGRNTLVVAADIAVYAPGAARPTGGAGAVAMLVGPDAPLVFDPVHGNHSQHAYDFYKADFTSEYPIVDGHYSLNCYMRALDKAYASYNKKAAAKIFLTDQQGMDRFDYSVFHVPNCKLVSKCFARLYYNDYRANPALFDVPEEVKDVDYEESLKDKNVEKVFLGLVKEKAATRLAPSLVGPTNTGNMYTGTLYSSLLSLLTHTDAEQLANKRVSLFSYGSGLASSFFSLVIKGDVSEIVAKADLKNKLQNREFVTPEAYEAAIQLRERAYRQHSFAPKGEISHLPKGTYYLTHVNEKFQREYAVQK